MAFSIPTELTAVQDSFTQAEEDAYNALISEPMSSVRVILTVKVRFAGRDILSHSVIDHTWPAPIPAIWARKNPNPISVSHDGISLGVFISPPADVPKVAVPQTPIAQMPVGTTDAITFTTPPFAPITIETPAVAPIPDAQESTE